MEDKVLTVIIWRDALYEITKEKFIKVILETHFYSKTL